MSATHEQVWVVLVLSGGLSLGSGCDLGKGDPTKLDCDGHKPSDGAEVAAQLSSLGYGEFNDTGGLGNGDLGELFDLVTEQAGWDSLVADLGTDGGLSPDFSTQAVFVHHWDFDGCSPDYVYFAWQWDNTIRVRAWQSSDEGCDIALPTRDLLLVTTGGLSDLGWCEE